MDLHTQKIVEKKIEELTNLINELSEEMNVTPLDIVSYLKVKSRFKYPEEKSITNAPINIKT